MSPVEYGSDQGPAQRFTRLLPQKRNEQRHEKIASQRRDCAHQDQCDYRRCSHQFNSLLDARAIHLEQLHTERSHRCFHARNLSNGNAIALLSILVPFLEKPGALLGGLRLNSVQSTSDAASYRRWTEGLAAVAC